VALRASRARPLPTSRVWIDVRAFLLALALVVACGGGTPGAPGQPDAPGTGGGDSGSGPTGLALLYKGPVAGAVVPAWSAADPRPLVVEARTGSTWWVSVARIDAAGAVSDIVADELAIWGWSSNAPDVLASGPLATTRVPGWSSASPRPLVLGARSAGDWVVAVAQVAPDGALSQLVVDDVTVWGWPVASQPEREYAGPLATAQLVPWNATEPRPVIVLANQSQPAWFVSMIGIEADGSAGGIVADSVELYRL
jgi:hypothetical protein